jgi:UPF0716 protein FxsA
MRLLLVFFILCPLLELWLLIKVGAWIGVLPTLALVVLSAWLGMALLRRVGWQTLSLTQLRMRRQVSPVPALFEGFILAVAGLLLLLPGLLSDGIGLLLLIPALRRRLAGRWAGPAMAGYAGSGSAAAPEWSAGSRADESHVIEGEYRREP